MIESLNNEKIKWAKKLLEDNRFRKKSGVFGVEGVQENNAAIKNGFIPVDFFICDSIYHLEFPKGRVHLVSENVYSKLAYRDKTEGIIGFYNEKSAVLADFLVPKNATIVVIEGVEKPGNLGAILRSCEAFGVSAVLVADPKIDFYNPNVIRSSVGCFFGMNVFSADNNTILDFLSNNTFEIYTTKMDKDAISLWEADFSTNSALVFGTEHSGLSDFWEDKGKNMLIPMTGEIDSLNLSNAVAISTYEAMKQKMVK